MNSEQWNIAVSLIVYLQHMTNKCRDVCETEKPTRKICPLLRIKQFALFWSLEQLVRLTIKDVISQKLNKWVINEYRAFSNTSDAIVWEIVCVTPSTKFHNPQAYLSKPQFSVFYNIRSAEPRELNTSIITLDNTINVCISMRFAHHVSTKFPFFRCQLLVILRASRVRCTNIYYRSEERSTGKADIITCK